MTMISSRRIAFAAAAIILGLTACGEASTTSSGVTATTPTTSPLAVIRLGSGANNTAGAPAADSSFATGEKMMAMRQLQFIFSGSLPSLPSSGAAWSFPANPDVDPARIAEVAALLGVTGQVRTLPADQGGGWMVGSAGYADASLTVSADGMASWWFSPSPSVYGTVGVSCPAYDPATSTEIVDTVPPCPEPQPPAGVPTGDEAKANAIALFTSMGYDMSSYEFDVYADEWSANVTAYLLLDGLRTPISLSAGYGANGALTWASGNLAQPQAAGDYPLVGADVGLQRLIDQQGMYGYGNQYMEGDMARSVTVPVAAGDTAGSAVGAPSVDPALPTEIAPPETLVTGEEPIVDVVSPTPTDVVLVDPILIDPLPVDSAPIDITLTDVRLDLTMQWDVDGTVWLLPAYAFSDADGGIYTVIAVADEYIQQPDVVDPPVAEVPVDPAVELPPVDPSAPSSGAAAECPTVVVPTGNTAPGGPLTEDDGKIFAGLCVADAQTVADGLGYVLRVVRLDGVDLAATADFVEWRVNVAIDNGIVTDIVSFG